MNKTPAIAFIIQSPVKNADELENEVDSFLGDWNNKIQKITPSDLRQYKRSVISRITKRDNKLSSRTQRYWRELDWGDTTFDARTKLANSVETISLDELAHCFDQLQTRRLSVRNSGTPFLQGQPKINDKTESLFSQLKSRGIHVPDV
jgi:secreted Zn-dependent insulinase-like peptidase